MLKSLQAWLGVSDSAATPEPAPLRELVNALDRFEPARAQFLARFAYLLGRVARADEHITDEETRTMERLLAEHGGLPPDQALLVVYAFPFKDKLVSAGLPCALDVSEFYLLHCCKDGEERDDASQQPVVVQLATELDRPAVLVPEFKSWSLNSAANWSNLKRK